MPSAATSPEDLERLLTSGFAARVIRWKASQLVTRAGFSPSDQEDLEQELRLDLLRRLPKFNAKLAHWNIFVRTLVERRAATLVVQRRSQLPTEHEDLHALAARDTQSDLAHDMEAILARLDARDRQLCEQLKQECVSEAARRTGVARRTFRDRVGRLRERLVALGLERPCSDNPSLMSKAEPRTQTRTRDGPRK